MGLLDNAKDAAEATGDRIREGFEDAKDRLDDKADEVRAEREVKQAEANRDATHAKNEYKESLRDN